MKPFKHVIRICPVAAIVLFGSFAAYAQTSTGGGFIPLGVICNGVKYPGLSRCPSSNPRPAPPPTTTTQPDDSARIEADRRAAEEARQRKERERLEAKRRADQEAQEAREKFEREKKDALDSLKGTNSTDLQLKGVNSSGELLKGTDTPAFELKGLNDPTTKGGPLARPMEGRELIVTKIKALATRLNWRTDEQERLANAMNDLPIPGRGEQFDANYERSAKNVDAAWVAIRNRKQPDELIAIAEKTKGWDLPAVGQQTNGECAVYALANASGLPYDFVRARAVFLIDQGEWRTLPEQINTDKTVKTGLLGDELLMLAESLGKVKIIKNQDFQTTLNSGRAVMIDVFAIGKHREGTEYVGQHQVALSRTFQYGGKTWYEMIDSHLPGAWDRRYVTEEELKTIQVENGIVFSPDPKPAAPKAPVKRKVH
jgi:hypothetical protein